jgi:hypothetical protein
MRLNDEPNVRDAERCPVDVDRACIEADRGIPVQAPSAQRSGSEAGQNFHDVNQVPSAASADAWTIPRIGNTVTTLMRRACFRFLLPRGSRSLALVFRPQRHGERSRENA